MTVPVKYIKDGRYYGIPTDSTIVWKRKEYEPGHFDFEKFKVRVEKLKEEGDKRGLATMRKNTERVCKDNPGMFDEFLTELLK